MAADNIFNSLFGLLQVGGWVAWWVVEWVAGWLGRGFGLPARQLARQPAGAGPVGAATCFPLVPDSLPDIHPPSPLPPPPPLLLLLLLLPVCCTASASPCPAPLLQYPLTTLGLHAGFTWINTAQAVVLLPLFCFAYYMYRWENADLVPIRWVGGWVYCWGGTAVGGVLLGMLGVGVDRMRGRVSGSGCCQHMGRAAAVCAPPQEL